MEAVSREPGILEVQIGSQRVRQVHAHLLGGFSLLHILSHVLCSVLTGTPSGGVSRERGILEVQISSQRVRQVHAHLLSGLSVLNHVYLTSNARY